MNDIELENHLIESIDSSNEKETVVITKEALESLKNHVKKLTDRIVDLDNQNFKLQDTLKQTKVKYQEKLNKEKRIVVHLESKLERIQLDLDDKRSLIEKSHRQELNHLELSNYKKDIHIQELQADLQSMQLKSRDLKDQVDHLEMEIKDRSILSKQYQVLKNKVISIHY